MRLFQGNEGTASGVDCSHVDRKPARLLVCHVSIDKMACSLQTLPQGLLELCQLATRSSAKSCCSSLIKASNRRSHSTSRDSAQGQYEPTIGLELHVQLKTHLKLFSLAETSYEAVPNTHVRPFDAALPGALPVCRGAPGTKLSV